MMWLGIMLACTVGAIALSDGNTNSIIKDNKEEFKYDENYCRNNLKQFYFNNGDCKEVSRQLKNDKELKGELEYLMKDHNDFNDSALILVRKGKIKL